MLGADDKENNLSPWQDSKTGSSTLPTPPPPSPSERQRDDGEKGHISSVV